MDFFIKRQVDAASAMTYNELAQVLEAKNPKTGKLFTQKDLNVIPMQKVGTSMLEDGIFVRGDWLRDPKHKDLAARFLRASLKGWEACRDKPADCVEIVLRESPVLGRDHPAAEDPRHRLHAVADAEDGHAGLEESGRREGRALVVDARRSAGQDDGLVSPQRLEGHRRREDLRVDVLLPDPPRDELSVLGAVVDDGDLIHGRPATSPFRPAALSGRPCPRSSWRGR